jgi:predicted glycosyltransferase
LRTLNDKPKRDLYFRLAFVVLYLKETISGNLYMILHQVSDNPKYFEKPDDYNDYDHNIKDGFDFMIHGDISVYKPQNKTCNY